MRFNYRNKTKQWCLFLALLTGVIGLPIPTVLPCRPNDIWCIESARAFDHIYILCQPIDGKCIPKAIRNLEREFSLEKGSIMIFVPIDLQVACYFPQPVMAIWNLPRLAQRRLVEASATITSSGIRGLDARETNSFQDQPASSNSQVAQTFESSRNISEPQDKFTCPAGGVLEDTGLMCLANYSAEDISSDSLAPSEAWGTNPVELVGKSLVPVNRPSHQSMNDVESGDNQSEELGIEEYSFSYWDTVVKLYHVLKYDIKVQVRALFSVDLLHIEREHPHAVPVLKSVIIAFFVVWVLSQVYVFIEQGIDDRLRAG